MIRVCDVISRGRFAVINFAAGDTSLLTKIGSQDQGVVLENKIFSRFHGAIMGHVRDLGHDAKTMVRVDDCLWTFSLAMLKEATSRAVAARGLPSGFCLYMLRHGGASTDVLYEWSEALALGFRSSRGADFIGVAAWE